MCVHVGGDKEEQSLRVRWAPILAPRNIPPSLPWGEDHKVLVYSQAGTTTHAEVHAQGCRRVVSLEPHRGINCGLGCRPNRIFTRLQVRAENCLGLALSPKMASPLWLSWVRSLPPSLVQTMVTDGGGITLSVNDNKYILLF